MMQREMPFPSQNPASWSARWTVLQRMPFGFWPWAVTQKPLQGEALPAELTLVGVMAIRDDVRPEAKRAISEVTRAGIQTVMITGDRKETAVAIAKDAGLLTDEKQIVLTSQELEALSDEQIKALLPDIRVIARALPTDKSRLVRIAQEMNLVVGMTGDGRQ